MNARGRLRCCLNGDVGLNGCVECTSYLEMCFELLISFSFQAHVRASNVEALQSSVYAEVEQEVQWNSGHLLKPIRVNSMWKQKVSLTGVQSSSVTYGRYNERHGRRCWFWRLLLDGRLGKGTCISSVLVLQGQVKRGTVVAVHWPCNPRWAYAQRSHWIHEQWELKEKAITSCTCILYLSLSKWGCGSAMFVSPFDLGSS